MILFDLDGHLFMAIETCRCELISLRESSRKSGVTAKRLSSVEVFSEDAFQGMRRVLKSEF